MKMKAAVVRESGLKVNIEEVELAPPKEKEILIKTLYTGLCHSDLGGVMGDFGFTLPYVPGHEASGVVVDTGPGVTTLKKGDKIIATWMVPCGTCAMCTSGRGHICTTSQDIHGAGTLLDGTPRISDAKGNPIYHQTFISGFAEYMVIPEAGAIKIKEGFPLDQACFIGCCMPTGFGAVTNVAEVKPGDSVAIWGLGGVGLNVVQGAKVRGADPIIGVDLEDSKEAIGREFGLTHFINNSKKDPVPKIQEITGGGADFCFEVTGDTGAAEQAYWAVGVGGRFVQIGAIPMHEPVALNVGFAAVHNKYILGTLYGNVRTHHTLPKYVDLIARGDYIDLGKLITKRFKIEQLNEALEALHKRQVVGRWVCEFDF